MTGERHQGRCPISPGCRRRVLTLAGEYGLAAQHELHEALLNACEAERLVLVDFQDVTFIDISSVEVLAGAHRRCRDADKQLVLMNVNGLPIRVLATLGLQLLLVSPRSSQDQPLALSPR